MDHSSQIPCTTCCSDVDVQNDMSHLKQAMHYVVGFKTYVVMQLHHPHHADKCKVSGIRLTS